MSLFKSELSLFEEWNFYSFRVIFSLFLRTGASIVTLVRVISFMFIEILIWSLLQEWLKGPVLKTSEKFALKV